MKKLILLFTFFCFFKVNVLATSLTEISATDFLKLYKNICIEINMSTGIEFSQTNKSFNPFTIELSAPINNNIDKTVVLQQIEGIFLSNNYTQYIDPSVKLSGIYLQNEFPISCLIKVEGDQLLVEFKMIDWIKDTYSKISDIAWRLTPNSFVSEYRDENGSREYIIVRPSYPQIDIKQIITQIIEGDKIVKQKGVWVKENDEWIGEFYNAPGKVVVTIGIDNIIFSIK